MITIDFHTLFFIVKERVIKKYVLYTLIYLFTKQRI